MMVSACPSTTASRALSISSCLEGKRARTWSPFSPAIAAISAEVKDESPRAITAPSGPAMSTTSPAAKSPFDPVTPTASRLRPWSLRTGTAQAFTRIVPEGLWKSNT